MSEDPHRFNQSPLAAMDQCPVCGKRLGQVCLPVAWRGRGNFRHGGATYRAVALERLQEGDFCDCDGKAAERATATRGRA